MTTILGCVLFQKYKRWNNLWLRFDQMWQVFPPWEKLRSHSKSVKIVEVSSEVWVQQRRLKWSSQWSRRKISRMLFLARQGREAGKKEGVICNIKSCRENTEEDWELLTGIGNMIIFGDINEYHFLGMVERITWLKWDWEGMGEYPGSPVVTILHFHCRGARFKPWLGN